jgi:hypothetical protein
MLKLFRSVAVALVAVEADCLARGHRKHRPLLGDVLQVTTDIERVTVGIDKAVARLDTVQAHLDSLTPSPGTFVAGGGGLEPPTS